MGRVTNMKTTQDLRNEMLEVMDQLKRGEITELVARSKIRLANAILKVIKGRPKPKKP